MNQFYLCQKLAPVGIAALSTIAVVGIAVAPAQAVTLKWSNEISDFIDDLNSVDENMFSVKFNPDEVTFISNVGDEFAPPFTVTSSPYLIETLKPAEGIFELITGLSSLDGILPEFNYQLMEDLVFDSGNGAVVRFKADPDDPEGDQPIFVGEFDPNAGTPPITEDVEFEIESTKVENVTVDIKRTINDFFGDSTDENFVTSGQIILRQAANAFEGDEYRAEVVVAQKTPEPGILLALLALGGLGLDMKRKKQE